MKRRLTSSKPRPAAFGLPLDVREQVLTTRQGVASGANAVVVMLYWRVGQRVRTDILKDKRAESGEGIGSPMSAQLMPDFGGGFAVRVLRWMIQFQKAFAYEKIVSTLLTQLNRTHLD